MLRTLAFGATLGAAAAAGTQTVGCNNLLLLTVGEGGTDDATNLNNAQQVNIEERTSSGDLVRSITLATEPNGGAPACTLGIDRGYGVATWRFDQDGVPSLAADGSLATFNCFNVAKGSLLGMTGSNVVVVTVAPDATVQYSQPLTASFTGTYGPSGVRQAITDDGSRFWLSGMTGTDSGLRFRATFNATTTDEVVGAAWDDIRGIGIFDGQLYGSAGNLAAEAQRGIFAVGSGLPTTTLTDSAVVKLAGIGPVWTFVFESANSLWASVESGVISVGNLVHYTSTVVAAPSAKTWAAAGSPLVLSAVEVVYSVSGRPEDVGAASHYIVYATSASTLFRYDTATDTLTTLYAIPGAQKWKALRGVVFPPTVNDGCTPTPTATSSSSSTATSSQSQTGTPSHSQTGTPSSSNTGTPSQTQTGTPSSSQTRTPSQTQTGTTSSSQTRTPSPSNTRTPSQTQTGTPSSSQTRTSSPSNTGTASQTKTGTPSPSQTRSASPSPVATTVACVRDDDDDGDHSGDDESGCATPRPTPASPTPCASKPGSEDDDNNGTPRSKSPSPTKTRNKFVTPTPTKSKAKAGYSYSDDDKKQSWSGGKEVDGGFKDYSRDGGKSGVRGGYKQ